MLHYQIDFKSCETTVVFNKVNSFSQIQVLLLGCNKCLIIRFKGGGLDFDLAFAKSLALTLSPPPPPHHHLLRPSHIRVSFYFVRVGDYPTMPSKSTRCKFTKKGPYTNTKTKLTKRPL